MSTDNYMTESALEAEYMEKKCRAAREKWVILEAAFRGFVAGGFLGAVTVAERQLVLAIVTAVLAVGLGSAAIYWRAYWKAAAGKH